MSNYKYSDKSIEQLRTCDDRLIHIFGEVIKVFNVSILEGYRNAARQNEAFALGDSELEYPNSKHNKQPSLAVDVAPYPIDFKQYNRYFFLAGLVKGISKPLGINIIWGGDWKNDNNFKNQTFFDFGHFEIVETGE